MVVGDLTSLSSLLKSFSFLLCKLNEAAEGELVVYDLTNLAPIYDTLADLINKMIGSPSPPSTTTNGSRHGNSSLSPSQTKHKRAHNGSSTPAHENRVMTEFEAASPIFFASATEFSVRRPLSDSTTPARKAGSPCSKLFPWWWN